MSVSEKTYPEEWGEVAELSVFRMKEASRFEGDRFRGEVERTATIFLDYFYRFRTHGEAVREFGIDPYVSDSALSVLLQMKLIREDLPGKFDITSKGTSLWLEMFKNGLLQELARKDG